MSSVTADYNLDLSSRGAANVSAALVGGYGIDPSRLSYEGAGLTKPIASNDTALAGEGPKPERIMVDATHLKAHRTAASLPVISGEQKVG